MSATSRRDDAGADDMQNEMAKAPILVTGGTGTLGRLVVPRLLLPLPIPGKAARAVRAGANLAPDSAVGRRTWQDFLGERVGPAGTAAPPHATMR
ncbi:hypothetical protein [Gaiella sp.]|uniref:hypothetical protein n=1 Tax=Gaiella sp. TaxID=2663207 RepID=UPI002E330C45|nr:hypothetical protein [Gaiella sp.]HEX5585496.1 hypothetical protein [Gaiella sp.]